MPCLVFTCAAVERGLNWISHFGNNVDFIMLSLDLFS